MKFSFLMPYFDRAEQFRKTLESFRAIYCGEVDFSVVVVEDRKNFLVPERRKALTNIITDFSDIKIHRHIYGGDGWNPAPMYNMAAEIATGEFYILTNPECLHTVNVLAGLQEEFRRDPAAYVVCGCQSYRGGQFHRWFQHSIHWNRLFHFCSALHRDIYWGIGGFDERFGDGIGYDDDDFRDRVVEAGIRVVARDDLVVVHQEHSKHRPPDYHARHARNRELWLRENPARLERAVQGRLPK